MANVNIESALYPKPAIPIAPVPSCKSFGLGQPNIPAITDLKNVLNLTSGRNAIGLAMQAINIKPGDEVLIPALHCISMIEPIVWLGGIPIFYPIEKDTSITPENIKPKLSKKTRAIIIVHFFGFTQDTPPIRELCDTNNLYLIEDCAHSYFGGTKEYPLGRLADYVIGSSLKFFPIYDGGCLCSNHHPLPSGTINNGTIFFELKSLFNIIERSTSYGRLQFFSPFINAFSAAMKMLKRIRTQPTSANINENSEKMTGINKNDAANIISSAADGGFHFDPLWVNIKMSASSRLIIALTNIKRLQEKRKENYIKWQNSISGIPGIRPLHENLPEHCVPHVFPTIVDDPKHLFPILKNMGLPVIRFGEFLWEGVDESVCPVSLDYSCRVFQFPCHQELTSDDIKWAISGLVKALTDINEYSQAKQ